jgi:hemerythrin-like domain-containing protein
MSADQRKPDLTFVNLIHQALRVDGVRLPAAIAELDTDDRTSRLAGIGAFFDEYREQLALHHAHEDTLFFPALEARVGADKMRLGELADQHEALDVAVQVASNRLAALANRADKLATHRKEVADAFSAAAEQLDAHLTLEEGVALPLFESEIPVEEYKKLETRARKATPRARARFLIPWLVAHATPEQQKALFKSAPPLRVIDSLNRRRYRRFDHVLVHGAGAGT